MAKGLKNRNELGVQYNRIMKNPRLTSQRKSRATSAFIQMNGRMGRLTGGKLGGEFTKFSRNTRMGATRRAATGMSAG